MPPNNQISRFTDKDMLSDILSTQKFVTDGYNTFANECATPCVKASFMNILNEEHQIQNSIFNEMNERGWYPLEAADQTKIDNVFKKYQSLNI